MYISSPSRSLPSMSPKSAPSLLPTNTRFLWPHESTYQTAFCRAQQCIQHRQITSISNKRPHPALWCGLVTLQWNWPWRSSRTCSRGDIVAGHRWTLPAERQLADCTGGPADRCCREESRRTSPRAATAPLDVAVQCHWQHAAPLHDNCQQTSSYSNGSDSPHRHKAMPLLSGRIPAYFTPGATAPLDVAGQCHW